jgi:opacity protein-like surface antigen
VTEEARNLNPSLLLLKSLLAMAVIFVSSSSSATAAAVQQQRRRKTYKSGVGIDRSSRYLSSPSVGDCLPRRVCSPAVRRPSARLGQQKMPKELELQLRITGQAKKA